MLRESLENATNVLQSNVEEEFNLGLIQDHESDRFDQDKI